MRYLFSNRVAMDLYLGLCRVHRIIVVTGELSILQVQVLWYLNYKFGGRRAADYPQT